MKIVLGAMAVLIFGWLLLLLDPGVRPAARRSQCKNNLKQIGLALHNYQEKYGCFPPAYITDENGRPMHSWRVLILPQLEQHAIYKEYRFDEPWDGPHNRKLAEISLPVFQCPEEFKEGANESRTTSYLAVVGPDTAWPGIQATALRDFTDGLNKTIHVVEVANSGIHWMEPRDLYVGQMAPTINPKAGQGMSSKHEGGAQALFGEMTVRFIVENLPAEKLRALLTRSAGDDPGEF